MTLDEVSDRIEKWCSRPAALVAFGLWCCLSPVLFGGTVANYGISVFTAYLMLLLLGKQRRSDLAMHVKLDDLEENLEEATTENVALEERTEDEIEARRKARLHQRAMMW